ncbi:hypothetical protein AVEN_100353-1 [Araneus ventricosus]|uniref:Uncharacterized protein n=1 Tax=Araneus ventricosus TaxID=182803 RepID=A0A4Y2KSS7_ARAVE|nr:hypothetical protein AVEN_100353-1 [Araneus ventricosus]
MNYARQRLSRLTHCMVDELESEGYGFYPLAVIFNIIQKLVSRCAFQKRTFSSCQSGCFETKGSLQQPNQHHQISEWQGSN